MNLVGPRPHPMCNHEIFMEHIAYYGLRSTVRPGVTGWAQVRYGYANNIEEETEKMRYDLYYIKNRSLLARRSDPARDGRIILLGSGREPAFGHAHPTGLSQATMPADSGSLPPVPVKLDPLSGWS